MSGPASELAHLFRALRAPAAARAFPALADRAREESWSYEKFLQALLATEVSVRDSHGGENRIKAARVPARKTLEEFDFTFQHSIKKQVIEHLGQLDFLHGNRCRPRNSVTSSSNACCKISRAPSRPTVSIGSSTPATPASTSSSSQRNLSLGATFSMRAYLHLRLVQGQSGGYARNIKTPGS